MKKYIALTALLAAGSAFANAAGETTDLAEKLLSYNSTDVWGLSFGSEYTNGYKMDGAMNKQGTFWDVSGHVVAGGVTTASNHRPHLAGGEYGSWTEDFQFTITLTLGETISASNKWPVFAEIVGNGTALRFGPYTGNDNKVAVDGNVTKGENNLVAVAPGGTYTVDLVKVGNDVTLYVNGALTGAGTLADSVSGNITDIALGGNKTDGYRINETVHSISYKTLSFIPEPSTFGLLAGLGALALVGTRRRRK